MDFNLKLKKDIVELYNKYFNKKSIHFIKKFNDLKLFKKVYRIFDDNNFYILVDENFNTYKIKKKKLEDYNDDDFYNLVDF